MIYLDQVIHCTKSIDRKSLDALSSATVSSNFIHKDNREYSDTDVNIFCFEGKKVSRAKLKIITSRINP